MLRSIAKRFAVMCAVLCVACGGARPSAEQIAEGLQQGDVVLRLGRGTKSQAVLQADAGGEYSHAGLVVRTDSGLMVVHAVPGEAGADGVDRVKMERLEAFYAHARAKKGLVLRLQDTTGTERAACYCRERCLAGMEFDHDYNLEDTTTIYCTELIWRAYLLSGVDVTDGQRKQIVNVPIYSGTYIFPSHFIKSGRYAQIKTLNSL